MPGRFLEGLVDSALLEAEELIEHSKKAAAQQQSFSEPDERIVKLAKLLGDVASEIEDKYIPKSAARSTLEDQRKEREFDEKLREVFVGENTDEETSKRREFIKRRIEQLGGMAAPSL